MPFLYGSKAHEPLSRLSPVKERLPPATFMEAAGSGVCEIFQHDRRKMRFCKLGVKDEISHFEALNTQFFINSFPSFVVSFAVVSSIHSRIPK